MRGKRLFLIYFILFPVLLAAALILWTWRAEEEAHYTPEYEQVDLQTILEKERLTDEDYVILGAQTGLARAGIDELYSSGRQEQLLFLQKRFFAPVEYECSRSFLIYRSERIVGEELQQKENFGFLQSVAGEIESVNNVADPLADVAEPVADRTKFAFLPVVHNGDILISFSGHFFGWRSGHAAIVINAEEGQTLEAVAVGCDSKICSLEHWEEYPCFALLRLKNATAEEREGIAAYAKDNLEGIPYEIFSFCELQTGEKEVEIRNSAATPEAEGGVSQAGTQCAHLVWLAYAHFGFDLDSDGGYIVTPHDIYDSDLLEIVQVYGLSPAF